MTERVDKLTSSGELTAYIGAHLVGIAVAFTTSPIIFRSLSAVLGADRQLIYLASFAISIVQMLGVLVIFLYARRLFIDAGPAPGAAASSSLPLTPPASKPLGAAPVAPGSPPGTSQGVISIVLGVLGLIPGIGALLSIVGLTIGISGRRRALHAANENGALLNLLGIIFSTITLVLSVGYVVFILLALSTTSWR
jgi:hypothetical protein